MPTDDELPGPGGTVHRTGVLAAHEVRLRLVDRTALLLAVASPLALFALIALAFLGGPSEAPQLAVEVAAPAAAVPRLEAFLLGDGPAWARVAATGAAGGETRAPDLRVEAGDACGPADGDGDARGPTVTVLRPSTTSTLAAELAAEWLHRGCPDGTAASSPALRVAPPDPAGGARHGPTLWLPSLGIFFLGFALLEGARSLLAEARDGRLGRLALTGVGPGSIVAAKMVGASVAGLLQFTVLAVVARFLFGYDWSGRPLLLVLLTLAVAAAFTGLGLLVATVVRSGPQALAWGGAVLLVAALLGGVFQPDEVGGAVPPALRALSFHAWALDGFRALLRGAPWTEVAAPVAVLSAFAAGAAAFATRRLGRRLELGGSP